MGDRNGVGGNRLPESGGDPAMENSNESQRDGVCRLSTSATCILAIVGREQWKSRD